MQEWIPETASAGARFSPEIGGRRTDRPESSVRFRDVRSRMRAPRGRAARLPAVPWTRWTTTSRFLRTTPIRLQLLFFAGTFFVFLPTGLLTDVSELGATPPGRLVLACVIAGGTAVAYTVVARFGAIWMAVLAPFHVFGLAALDWARAARSAVARGAP